MKFDIGKIKINWKGDYSPTVKYEKDDAVYHNGSSYIFISEVPLAGTAPVYASSSVTWELMALGGFHKPASAYSLVTKPYTYPAPSNNIIRISNMSVIVEVLANKSNLNVRFNVNYAKDTYGGFYIQREKLLSSNGVEGIIILPTGDALNGNSTAITAVDKSSFINVIPQNTVVETVDVGVPEGRYRYVLYVKGKTPFYLNESVGTAGSPNNKSYYRTTSVCIIQELV